MGLNELKPKNFASFVNLTTTQKEACVLGWARVNESPETLSCAHLRTVCVSPC